VFAVLACYDLVSVSGQYDSAGVTRATASRPAPPPGQPSGRSSSAVAPPPGQPSSPAPHSLPVASVAAFGPEGIADGDNPGIASRVLAVSTDQPWYSQWYATPEFGNLRPGTGLLLDLGGTATIADVRLVLGPTPGADVQVRVGDSASLPGLATAASASDVSGAVNLPSAAPARGRYVLIWFTRLPPNAQPGEYQVAVYGVTVDGTA
jgi:hypothetical protein